MIVKCLYELYREEEEDARVYAGGAVYIHVRVERRWFSVVVAATRLSPERLFHGCVFDGVWRRKERTYAKDSTSDIT